ncbi:hypothetical protein Q4601_11170 [Shewanella sp. 1_MG-2023]|uniref:hypothetical protein n=1 Tax=unclassified Shewanella TaxID=196818 RepID=UPI0026E1F3DF|nr:MULTISPECIES: hypothetical protein [unclassified Shewanella]MDO6612743.1 hypothetical protein [Shewanella sp. 7_MG-2023]MDO6772704.1 hypothetical protein [Shewanella sp. 2_MG-2023]MDO6794868.1 hypothetical protein [Shewanella sp. 1_MG-2023]
MNSPSPSTQPSAKVTKNAFRNPFKGFYSLWLRDFGSLSFLMVALLGCGLTILTIITKPEKIDVINLALGMTILSMSCAVAWQLIKLSANECAMLIPHYRKQVLIQASSIWAVSLFLSFVAIELSELTSIATLMLFVSIGTGFIYACLIKPQRFNYAMLVFLVLPITPQLINYIPQLLADYIVLIPVLLGFLIDRKLKRFSWNQDARAIYLNGLETGWMVGPIVGQNPWFIKLSRYLHPASFFIGPMLGMMLIVSLVLSAVGVLFAAYIDADFPILMVLSQLMIMVCALIHWTRVQRWRAAETLYMLPSFNGKAGLVEQFFKSQLRLMGIVIMIMSLITLLSALFNSQITLMVGLHIVATTTWASGLALAFGAMSRSTLHVSLSMLLVFSSAIWLSTSLVGLREQGSINVGYYWGDLGLLLLMGVLLVISRNKLWKNGVAGL